MGRKAAMPGALSSHAPHPFIVTESFETDAAQLRFLFNKKTKETKISILKDGVIMDIDTTKEMAKLFGAINYLNLMMTA